MNPGDQTGAIEQYLIAKGEDGPFVRQEAMKAAMRIAAIAAQQMLDEQEQEKEQNNEQGQMGKSD